MKKTTTEIDKLIREAQDVTGIKTEREVMEKALKLFIQTEARQGILEYFGSGIWKGSLKRSRRNRV